MELKPATDVLAGAVARAASQGTIHPLDTLKVRLQTRGGKGLQPPAAHTSKFSKLLPPAGQSVGLNLRDFCASDKSSRS